MAGQRAVREAASTRLVDDVDDDAGSLDGQRTEAETQADKRAVMAMSEASLGGWCEAGV
jgi:hypothetical protein